ncbi:DUF3307 domain-containing protein [Streptomyces cacaoi]|uniref:DUF3307 domain-containing protein n=1 Tax=Streptomyces cacaoi TaxID=1898 RepID=UPI0011F354DD|nr:DUF3307 domain-containing protein [Streptomyces cacaoi]
MTNVAVFAAVFVTLYVAHSVGDHWVQTSEQAIEKGSPGWRGRLADARHVLGLTVTKLVALTLVVTVLDVPVTAVGLAAGLTVDAVSHWWADRRTTLFRLAKLCRKTEFYNLGTAAHEHAPVTVKGTVAAHLGTGAYALDQSFHHAFLLVAALLIAAL